MVGDRIGERHMTGAASVVMGGNQTGGGGGGGLVVAIGPGVAAASNSGAHTFPANTCVVSGGTASYAYEWSDANDDFGAWTLSGAATSACTPHVGMVFPANSANASVICTVTDSSTPPKVQASPVAAYSYFNNNPA